MQKLWLDFETHSETPITHGVHAYAAKAEILLCAYAIDEGPVKVFEGADFLPADFAAALKAASVEVWAHNSYFDRTIMCHCWGWSPELNRWRDTMVQALSVGLPARLDALCAVLNVPADTAKLKHGRQLIQLFCKPQRGVRATGTTHPEQWALFKSYASNDVAAMRACAARMPSYNYSGAELALWHLDQRINDRGVCVDTVLVAAAIHAVAAEQTALAAATAPLTGGAVDSTTKRAALLAHVFERYGVRLEDLQKSTVAKTLEADYLDPALRALLVIRQQVSTTSTSKYKALLTAVSSDGRLRGALQFSGASRTGRWAGRLFQPQNLPRPTLSAQDIEQGIAALKTGCADLVAPNVMALCSSALRGCLVAPQGCKLVIADLANIEGRVLAWLAGEKWKLQAFAQYDASIGPDLYKLAYARAFGVPVDGVTKDQRQIGKVMELMLGYGGGVGAFVTGAAGYGFDVDDIAASVHRDASSDVLAQSAKFYDWAVQTGKPTHQLSRRSFIAADALKRMWRAAHPETVALWSGLDDAVRVAIARPGTTAAVSVLKCRVDGGWLRIVLPSGRSVCYPNPAIVDGVVTYDGNDQHTRKWSPQRTYGGKLTENVCQAVARDVMAANMPLIEAAGYRIVLTVHDEILSETPDTTSYSASGLGALLAATPTWGAGLPLAASGFETLRYSKD